LDLFDWQVRKPRFSRNIKHIRNIPRLLRIDSFCVIMKVYYGNVWTWMSKALEIFEMPVDPPAAAPPQSPKSPKRSLSESKDLKDKLRLDSKTIDYDDEDDILPELKLIDDPQEEKIIRTVVEFL
jgi:hypothetical protein